MLGKPNCRGVPMLEPSLSRPTTACRRGLLRAIAGVLAAGGLLVMLAACDAQRIEKLEEGVATEDDVRRQFGTPFETFTEADGTKVLEYPRQPEGWTNYRITIGPDGKMSSLRQLLTPANFARIQPGMNKLDVMRTLGKAAKTQSYALKGEEVWDWRFKDGPTSRIFSVTFDAQGRVLGTGTTDDTRETQGGS